MTTRVTFASLTTVIVAASAHAQDAPAAAAASASTSARPPSTWAVGGAVGVPGVRRSTSLELTTVAVQWTRFRPRRLGADVALGVAPRFVAEGALAGGLRVGAALPLPLGPRAFVVPSIGVGGLAVAGGDGADGVVGVNGGGALVWRAGRNVGVRAGITWHRFDDWDGTPWLLEVGLLRLPASALGR